MTTLSFVALLIALTVLLIWAAALSYRVDRLQRRLEDAETDLDRFMDSQLEVNWAAQEFHVAQLRVNASVARMGENLTRRLDNIQKEGE